MLKLSNLCCVLTAGIVVLAVSAARADNRAPVRLLDKSTGTPVATVSLSTSGDCTKAAPAPEYKTYKPCVCYRGCCDCCGPKASQVLKVKDPCDCCCSCCLAEIPVCLPACCKDPKVCCSCGLFGRGIVTYSYDCGCCVTIIFRRCGDVVVKYS
jgi:hypothetical protein